MPTLTEVTFEPDTESFSPAFQSQPDNEWRIEFHGSDTDEWTVWRWVYAHEEWEPVAITVDEGYPLPETVVRSKGFSTLDQAVAWVRQKCAIQETTRAVSGLLDEVSDDLTDACLPLRGLDPDAESEFAVAYREWQRATTRLLGLATAAALDGDLGNERG